MKRQYDEHCKSTQVNGAGNLGGLSFDEVKIKEGLVYDMASGRLVEFIDDTAGADDVTPEKLLATNISPVAPGTVLARGNSNSK